MKRVLLFIFALCLYFDTTAQYTQMPTYEKKKPWTTSVELIGIGTSDDEVVVSLAISGGYNFSNTYLEYTDPSTGNIEKVYLKDIWRETGEYARQLAIYGYDYYTLVFSPLPNGVNKINLISEKPKVYGISIRPVVRTIQNKRENRRMATSESEVEQLINNSNLPIAGFYENTTSATGRFAIVQTQLDSIYVLYVGYSDSSGWKFGERTAALRPTSVSGFYKAVFYENEEPILGGSASFERGIMTLVIDEQPPIIFLKMGDVLSSSNNAKENATLWSGTGFALANGYIVTNDHVIEDAKNIGVTGVKGDMNTRYTAEVVTTDKVNDIAILRINDSRFTGFGTIPYAVQQRMADVGEDVFVLGYPLTQALGNEIKLTNGIISSRTGYQGNISTYQMSAPVQPGNSGGPMFDNKGNVIGIVVAGVPGAENVGYAIKTSYLNILIESAGLNIKLPTNNTISSLSLAEKVKRVKDYVFYIECSK